MSYVKSAGTSAKGNDRLLQKYGGNAGSSPMARQHYATGGAVKGGNPALAEGMAAADGAPAKRSLSRPGRKMAGKGKKKDNAKTNINIIVAGGDKPGGPPPMPLPPMDGPPPGPPMPPPGPPPGGPPMPMRKHGGAVGKFAKGGRVKKMFRGGEADVEVRQAASDRASNLRKKANEEENVGTGKTAAGLVVGGALPGALLASRAGVGKKILGTIGAAAAGTKMFDSAMPNLAKTKELREKASDEDHTAAGYERKSGGRVNRASGGKVGDGGEFHGLRNRDGGAMSGKGRLAKVKMYGK